MKKPKVWRRFDERLVNNMMYPTHSANSFYSGYWGDISDLGVGSLFIIPHNTHMNAVSFKSVMEEVIIFIIIVSLVTTFSNKMELGTTLLVVFYPS